MHFVIGVYSSWGSTAGSNLSLVDQSTANLSLYSNSADVVEQFGLHLLNPSPLHYAAIQGVNDINVQ